MKTSPLKAGMRKAHKVLLSIKRMKLSKMGGSLVTPTTSQMTDVIPNRWGEPVSRPSGWGGGQHG